MKQRLRNLKGIKLIIAAALVAAIVIAIIFISHLLFQNNNLESLKELQEASLESNSNLKNKYSELSEEEKKSRRQNLKDLIDDIFSGSNQNKLRSLEESKELLKALPDAYAEIIERNDIYSVMFGLVQSGLSEFEKFTAEIRLNKPACLIMAQFTTNFDPIYYLVEYDGSSFHVVEDKTRDGYDDDSGYSECTSKYLKFEQYPSDEGIIEYGYLTNDFNLSYKKIQDYFSEVEKTSETLKAPDFWQFYIATISGEELKNRMISGDRLSKEFKAEYTGYTDVHPSFASDNGMDDFDDDGILDRIYREYSQTEGGNSSVNVYLYLGNGNNILLGRNIWGEDFKTGAEDFTGDGHKDIYFIQHNQSPEQEYGISIFEYRNGNFILMQLPEKKYSSLTLDRNSSGKSVIKCITNIDARGNYEEELLEYLDGDWKIG